MGSRLMAVLVFLHGRRPAVAEVVRFAVFGLGREGCVEPEVETRQDAVRLKPPGCWLGEQQPADVKMSAVAALVSGSEPGVAMTTVAV